MADRRVTTTLAPTIFQVPAKIRAPGEVRSAGAEAEEQAVGFDGR